MPRTRKRKHPRRSARTRQDLGRYMRRPGVLLGILILVGIVIFLIASLGEGRGGTSAPKTEALPALVSIDEAYRLYRGGTFVLDVSTKEQWNEFHAPNTTLIPLEELPARVNELPAGQPIVVVCRTGNRSQIGRDYLRGSGFNATSLHGGMEAWRARGYEVVSGP